uniref:A mating type protein n=1 Tax=Coprinopsis cinerea TaxID=5346 RepID=Q00354_COPCI|nr:A mating type protein [Coprinopsis cinerea]
MIGLENPELWGQLRRATGSGLVWLSVGAKTKLLFRPAGHRVLNSSSSPQIFPLLLSFTQFVSSLHLTPSASEQLVLKVDKVIEEQRTLHLTNYQRMCGGYLELSKQQGMEIDPISVRNMQTLVERSFQQLISRIQSEIMERYQQTRQQLEVKRTPFNSEYTPLLEKYFEYNAYPSARDREWLARKTMMSVRQIEVWFQNHRRRARKEGIHFERLPMDRVPVELSLESLEKKLSPLTLPHKVELYGSRLPTPPPDANHIVSPCIALVSPDQPRAHSILDRAPGARHAYPTVYRKDGHNDDLFPCKRGNFNFPAPIWDRCSSTTPPKPRHCTMDQLCQTFAATRIRGPSKDQEDPGQPGPWYASRVTGPIIAPHPAAIRPSEPRLRLQKSVGSPRPSRQSPSPRRERQVSTPAPKPSNRRQEPRSHTTTPSPSLPTTFHKRTIPRLSSQSSLSFVDSSDLDTPDGSPSMSPASALPPIVHEHIGDPYAVINQFDKATSPAIYLQTPFNYWRLPSRPPLGLNSLFMA